jgi:hypothetical protein
MSTWKNENPHWLNGDSLQQKSINIDYNTDSKEEIRWRLMNLIYWYLIGGNENGKI